MLFLFLCLLLFRPCQYLQALPPDASGSWPYRNRFPALPFYPGLTQLYAIFMQNLRSRYEIVAQSFKLRSLADDFKFTKLHCGTCHWQCGQSRPGHGVIQDLPKLRNIYAELRHCLRNVYAELTQNLRTASSSPTVVAQLLRRFYASSSVTEC